jgi:hypothetical protein
MSIEQRSKRCACVTRSTVLCKTGLREWVPNDGLLSLVRHVRGRVFVSLANEKIIVFHRQADGTWDLDDVHLIVTGQSRESVRCMIQVEDTVWCGVANRMYVFDAQSLALRVRFLHRDCRWFILRVDCRSSSRFIRDRNVPCCTWPGQVTVSGYPFVYPALCNCIKRKPTSICRTLMYNPTWRK